MPNFVECDHCRRLYSAHSIGIHSKQCSKEKRASSSCAPRKKRKKRRSTDRPRTRSLSRPNCEENLVCFVCGAEFEPNLIEQHRRACFQEWKSKESGLKTRFILREPSLELRIPSVDGTIDVGRENELARRSSMSCQLARCAKCHQQVPIHLAECHRCIKHQPTVEFYY